jgi:hypothetical protein
MSTIKIGFCYCVFKDQACGYTGPATSCDKTPQRCQELGNLIHFRGGPIIDATPAGGSPPRPVPAVRDEVEVVKLPDIRDSRLKMGQRGQVVSVKGAMFSVRFPWGVAYLNSVQIELRSQK